MPRATCFRIVLLASFVILGAVGYQATTEDLMVETANDWLSSLNSAQIASAQFKLDIPDYDTWHFVPGWQLSTEPRLPPQWPHV